MHGVPTLPGGVHHPLGPGLPYAVPAGLGPWVSGLGLTAVQLAENVEAGYRKHIPTDLQAR